jgi:hypothetical protein
MTGGVDGEAAGAGGSSTSQDVALPPSPTLAAARATSLTRERKIRLKTVHLRHSSPGSKSAAVAREASAPREAPFLSPGRDETGCDGAES